VLIYPTVFQGRSNEHKPYKINNVWARGVKGRGWAQTKHTDLSPPAWYFHPS